MWKSERRDSLGSAGTTVPEQPLTEMFYGARSASVRDLRLTPPFPFVVVGSPEYLRRRGRPESIDDLRQHACLRSL